MKNKFKKFTSALLALVMLCGVLAVAPVAVHAEELQVYETSTGGKYSLIPDEENPGMYVLHLIEGSFTGTAWEHTQNYASYWDANWGEYSGEDVISITVDDDVNTPEKDVKITGDCSYMFKSYFPNCKSIDFSNADTSGIGNMNLMFAECHALEVLNIYGFKSSGRASTQMFAKCENLKELLISTNFQVISSMQLNNGKISDKGWIESDSVDGNIVSGTGDYAVITPDDSTTYIWAASSPQYIFNEQTGVLHLISGFFRGTTWQYTIINTWESIWTALDFEGKDVLSITAGKNVKFANDCSFMFKSNFPNCTSIDLHNVDTSNVEKMTGMFLECNSLESVNLSGFDTTKVSKMIDMFAKDPNLSSLDLSSFDMNSVDSTYMFDESIELKELTISDKFIGGINGGMKLNNNQYENIQWYNGWRVKGDPEANKVSGDGGVAVITNPDYLPGEGETKTYIWIGYYDVDWLNEDGTKLSVEQYKVDADDIHPTYKGATPTNPDTEDTTSTFVGWVDDLGNEYGVNDVLPIVTRDTTYTARFEAPKTEYTLNYIYQGRSGGNNGGYIGDNGASDTKTYTVTVELGDSDLKESGMPKDKVLVDNAPVVNDPYKNCRWTIDDEHVIFDPETKIVTITAEQPERKYSVVFKNSNNETTDVFRVKLNDFVKKNDSFITAEETDGSGTKFAYWSVVQNNKEVARCFERKFNLRVTGDSVVTANYGEAENLISLSDAEITRQPIYQNGIPKDCLYADFITAYMDKQGMELSKKSSSEYKTGLILQYNKEILVKENEPGATLNANDKITFGSDYELTAADAKTIADGETVSGKYSYKSISIDNSKYNDKNRLNKALPIENTELNRRMVYCAYYYVYNVKAGKIEMTAPVYFYLYDKGNEINTEN